MKPYYYIPHYYYNRLLPSYLHPIHMHIGRIGRLHLYNTTKRAFFRPGVPILAATSLFSPLLTPLSPCSLSLDPAAELPSIHPRAASLLKIASRFVTHAAIAHPSSLFPPPHPPLSPLSPLSGDFAPLHTLSLPPSCPSCQPSGWTLACTNPRRTSCNWQALRARSTACHSLTC
ncbi:hypothetical protein BX600DRAFT_453810 [Xylariales sp. PMI_506]|nr:hypothetical protein BX600DRAFT_453810 [Xylariales sp. PMI_506]